MNCSDIRQNTSSATNQHHKASPIRSVGTDAPHFQNQLFQRHLPLLCFRLMLDQLFQLAVQYWPALTGVAVVTAVLLLLRMYSQPRWLPYEPRKAIVTKSELRFYKSLRKAALDDWEVFAMVRIADLLKVTEHATNRRTWLNKILSKHIDFVLCDPNTLQAVVAIELDDVSHQRPERIERDKFVNLAFESAGLPLLRIPVEPSYKAREVRDLIESALKN